MLHLLFRTTMKAQSVWLQKKKITFDKPSNALACKDVIWLSLRLRWSRFFSNLNARVGTSFSWFFDKTRWLRIPPCEDILAVSKLCISMKKMVTNTRIFDTTSIILMKEPGYLSKIKFCTYHSCECINVGFSFPWICDQLVLEYLGHNFEFWNIV